MCTTQPGLGAHYLDQVDLMFSAEGLHQLDVHGFVTVGCKGAKMGLTPAKEHVINLQRGLYTHHFIHVNA